MRFFFWKELRENRIVGLLLFAIVSLAFGENIYQCKVGSINYDQSITLYSALICAFCFGFFQTFRERKIDRWAFMMHRPISLSSIFLAKSFAGILIVILSVGIPFFGWLFWMSIPGNLSAPFDWRLSLRGISDLTASLAFYFAGMLVALRPVRWWGTRIWPLLAAGCFTMLALTSLLSNNFLPSMITLLVGATTLGFSAWGSFVGKGEYETQPFPARMSLLSILLVGWVTVICFLGIELMPLLSQLNKQDESEERIQIHKDGRILRLQHSGGKTRVFDLHGTEVLSSERNPWSSSDFNDFLEMDGIYRYAEGDSLSYRYPERYFWKIDISNETSRTWYYTHQYGRFVRYLRGKIVGSIGPEGYSSSPDLNHLPHFDTSGEFDWRQRIGSDSNGTKWFGPSLFENEIVLIDFEHRQIKKIPVDVHKVSGRVTLKSKGEASKEVSIFRLNHSLIVYDHQKESTFEFFLTEKQNKNLDFHVHYSQDFLRLYFQILDDPAHGEKSFNLYQFNGAGVLQKTTHVDEPKIQKDRADSWIDSIWGAIAPLMTLLIALGVEFYRGNLILNGREGVLIVLRSNEIPILYIYMMVLGGILSAYFTVRKLRSILMPQKVWIPWAMTNFLFGLVGWLTLISSRDWRDDQTSKKPLKKPLGSYSSIKAFRSPMTAMFWKEFREVIPWVLSGAGVFALIMGWNYHKISSQYYCSATPFHSDVNELPWIASAIAGLFLALGQFEGERKIDRWAFLVHRPFSIHQIFLTKITVGLGSLWVSFGFVYSLVLSWFSVPGRVASPFEWEMALPGCSDLLLGGLFYFAGILIMARKVRWWGTRLLPIFAAYYLMNWIHGTGGWLFSIQEFHDAILLIGVALLLFGFLSRHAYLTLETKEDKPSIRSGLFVVYLLALALLLHIGPERWIEQWRYREAGSQEPVEYLSVDRTGRILRILPKIDGTHQILDLKGNPAIFEGRGEDFDLNSVMAQSSYFAVNPKDKVKYSYQDPNRFFIMMGQNHAFDHHRIWYYEKKKGLIVGYPQREKDRRANTWVGANGVFTDTSKGALRFSGELCNDRSGDDYFLFSWNQVYLFDFDHPTIKPITGVAPVDRTTAFKMRGSEKEEAGILSEGKISLYDSNGNRWACIPMDEDLREGYFSVKIPDRKDRVFVEFYDPIGRRNQLDGMLLREYSLDGKLIQEQRDSYRPPPDPRMYFWEVDHWILPAITVYAQWGKLGIRKLTYQPLTRDDTSLLSPWGINDVASRLCASLLWLFVGGLASQCLKRRFSKQWAFGIILFGPIAVGAGLLLPPKPLRSSQSRIA